MEKVMEAVPFGPILALALLVLGLILAVVWIFVPFAIMGTKPLLRELLAEQRRTNKLLADLSTRGLPPMSL